jgi:hypothetical protein
MHNLLQSLQQITQEVLSNLEQIKFEHLETFVEHREQIIIQLQAAGQSLDDKEKKLIEDILQHDVVIMARMQQLKDEASYGINKIDRARVQSSAYYAEYTPDSIFFDRRK